MGNKSVMRISFLAYDLDCDPEVLTKGLGLKPTSTERLGEKSKNGLPRPFSSNAWELSSELDDNELSHHIEHLLSTVGEVSRFSNFSKSWRIKFNCVLEFKKDDNSLNLYLSQNIIKKLASIGAEIDFDYQV